MKTKVVQVLIRRGLTSQHTSVVYAHEIPILKVVRGGGNVEIDESADCKGYELKPTSVKPRDELIRLKRKYKGFVIEGQHPVDVAFPDGSRDLELYYEDPSAFDQAGEEDTENFFPDDVETEASDEAEDDKEDGFSLELPEETPSINLNDRPSVMAKLNELGVPFAKTTATKHLAKLLTESLEAGATD